MKNVLQILPVSLTQLQTLQKASPDRFDDASPPPLLIGRRRHLAMRGHDPSTLKINESPMALRGLEAKT